MKPATLWVALTSLLLLAACSKQPQWTLFYYPDIKMPDIKKPDIKMSDIDKPDAGKPEIQSQLTEQPDRYHAIAGYYQTLQQCQDKGRGMQRLNEGKGSFECGHNCRLDDRDMVICDQWHTNGP
ncbi:hypothetical protein [Shewanella algae]|uniref:hypothetical protein n=1 Tax=Shewanella algae TaxID=38313 RepID=UPI0013200960|nr:hypothetical protein [Shewanella algae]QHD52860.1 hypothetical protein GM320_06625 [Shewanella algae]